MFLNEHVLYGSSRLGTVTYDKYKMGYSGKSLAYPAISPVVYVCYEEADQNPAPFLLVDGGTGPIGGNWEIIKPYGPHRVTGTRVPVTGINLPWAGNDVNVQPTKEGTFFVPGRKRYEFSNHLGNVLVTISDMPLGVDADSNGTVDYYMPDVKTTSDYEPFGAPLNDRTLSENGAKYRYGFNGVEKNNELYGENNAYDFEYRIHDARTGRFLSVDPLFATYPWNSPYAFAENRPIDGIDLEGKEHQWYVVTLKNDGSTILKTEKVPLWPYKTEVGSRGWGNLYTYVDEQGRPVPNTEPRCSHVDFMKTPSIQRICVDRQHFR